MRRRLVFAGFGMSGVIVCALVAGASAAVDDGGSGADHVQAAAEPLKDMADTFLVEQDGGWFCPRGNVEAVAVCPQDRGEGGTSRDFAERLIEHIVAHPELDPPSFLRAGKARNDCSSNTTECTTGVPATPAQPCLSPTLPPDQYAVSSPYCALKGLSDVGIQLGVVVGAATDAQPDGSKPARSVRDITYHACKINQADTGNLYDFMFLDLAFKLQDAQLIDVLGKIQGGVYWNPAAGQYEACPYGAWPQLITNDTTYPNRTLATGAWGHAKSFAAMEGDDWREKAEGAANGTKPAIRDEDWNFIRDVHTQDPGSHPVLRFEVPSQTDRFAQLGGEDQCSLLRRWAKQQKQSDQPVEHFSMIYPLYVHGIPDKPRTYDSFFRGTFLRQLELIHFYNPDLSDRTLSPCPQPAS